MRHQLESRFGNTDKNRNANGYSIEDALIMRQIQLEKHSFQGASIIVATVEDRLVKSPIDQGDGKNAKERIRHPGVTPKGCLRE